MDHHHHHPLFLPILFSMFFAHVATSVAHSVGVNWGSQASHPLPSRTVVRMLKANNVNRVKLLYTENSVLLALANTGIEATITIPDELLSTLTDVAEAHSWVQNNVVRYTLAGTKIRYVAVGTELYGITSNDTYAASALPALRNMQAALKASTVGDQVKVTFALSSNVLTATRIPSDAVFRADIIDTVTGIITLLADYQYPITFNICPFLSLYTNNNFSVDYAFFDGRDPPLVDGEYIYHNMFDASYDALVVALFKVGFSNMSIIVGGIGWPTDGNVNANISFAQRFNQGLIDHLALKRGTPRKPYSTIDFYLMSLIDEDMKSLAAGNFERHWGIFRYDGVSKYQLSLTGSERKLPLVSASGVKYLAKQWCVLNPDVVDTSTLPDSISYACSNADCTALGFGCSCNQYLDAVGNASYAFNAYFQRQDQQLGSCSFNGLGHIVTTDPSINSSCQFIIQLAAKSSPNTRTLCRQSLVGLFLLVLLVMLS